MQRLRKTSLSPCYSNMNKENLPIDNINSPIGISFRNLEQIRKKKVFDQIRNQDNEYFTGAGQTNKGNRCDGKGQTSFREQVAKIGRFDKVCNSSRRDSQKSVEQYRSSLKSKQKQMSSLHSQVETLNSTIALLKEQVNVLKSQNKSLLSDNQQQKRVLKEKMEIIQRLKDSEIKSGHSNPPISHPPKPTPCQKCRKDKQTKADYDEVTQKLNELEQIQNKILIENESLKKKQNMNAAMFKNLQVLIKDGRYGEVSDLLVLLND